MSALYLDGVTKGENQMMATGILLMFASLAFSYARPVEKVNCVCACVRCVKTYIYIYIYIHIYIYIM
jgi:hypothetical protein